MCFAVTPFDAHTSHPNCIIQSWPLAIAVVHWPFQVSLLSMITPRNLAVSAELMQCCPKIRSLCGIGIHFLRLNVCGIVCLDMLMSWNFLTPNSQLCNFAHWHIPPAQFMILHSFSCISAKSFLTTITAASSMKSSIHSPSLSTVIFSRSALYSR